MAVEVDISGSKHLTFSTINDKHNILYSGARNSFNQRYKQTPWFRLNPFTDRGVGKGETIDRYDPTHDAGLSLLQSLVIVEDYFSDTPQLVKEFNISEFWDFLFSDSWSSGHYVRVFEGQLLDMIFSCLLSLTNSRKLVQHDTKAFAKNKRQKYSMIKQETKAEQDSLHFTETLFLKFSYYGHVVKPACFDPESSIGYPDMTTTTTTTNSSWLPETADIDTLGEASSTICLKTSDTISPSPPPPEAKGHIQHPRKKRVRASRETLLQIDNERVLMARFMSNNDSLIQIPPIPRGSNYRYTCSNFSNASDDYKSLPPRVDLNNFICTEKASYMSSEKAMYLGEFKLPPEDCHGAQEGDDDHDFGQHLYLGDNKQPAKEEEVESIVIKLQKKKEILQQDRERTKQFIAKLKQRDNKIMPEFSELDVQKYVKDHEVVKIIAVPESDIVPTFEEYAESLDAELKRETKVKIKRMVSTIKNKSALNMGKIGGMLLPAGMKGGSNVKSSAQRMLIFEQLMKAKKKKPETVKRTNKIVVPLVYISMPSGLTLLHPLSRPLLHEKMAEEHQKRQEAFKPKNTKRRKSLLPVSGTALSNELTKVRLTSKSNQSKQGPKFPKIKLVPSNESLESSDEHDSEEDVEDTDQDEFNSKKLNIKYSKDRMKKAKAARKAAERKNKSHIYDLLKKYCRLQSVFKALGGGPTKKRRRSSVAGLPLSNRRKKKLCETLETCEKEKNDSEVFVDVGKLKKFAFLEAKEKAKTPTSEQMKSLFNNYPMELFCENLERSLKDFVVRREIVTSDYNGKTLVSITFTKKSVFTTSKFSSDQ